MWAGTVAQFSVQYRYSTVRPRINIRAPHACLGCEQKGERDTKGGTPIAVVGGCVNDETAVGEVCFQIQIENNLTNEIA